MTANIVREIVNKCRNNGLKIEESFITYYVRKFNSSKRNLYLNILFMHR